QVPHATLVVYGPPGPCTRTIAGPGWAALWPDQVISRRPQRRESDEEADGVVDGPVLPRVRAEDDDLDEDHHQVLTLLGPVVDHHHEVEEVEQEAADGGDRREEAERETETDGELAEHDDVRHLLRPRRHDLVEPGADEAPLVLVGHRLRPRDAGAPLEPTLLVLVPPALQPPQAEADAQHREPLETAQPRRHHSNTSR